LDPTTTSIGLLANLFLGPEAKGTFSRYNARIRARLYATFDGVIKLAGALSVLSAGHLEVLAGD
jgi:hypothetical protein